MLLGEPIRFFDLIHDLRFTEHHAVEARRDSKQMPHRVWSGLGQQFVREFVERNAMKVRDEFRDLLPRRCGIRRLLSRIDLDPIARREDDKLGRPKPASQFAIRRFELVTSKREPLTYRQVGRLMIAVDDLEVHVETSLIAVTKPTRSVSEGGRAAKRDSQLDASWSARPRSRFGLVWDTFAPL